jgi:phage major capsid protein, HK97 family
MTKNELMTMIAEAKAKRNAAYAEMDASFDKASVEKFNLACTVENDLCKQLMDLEAKESGNPMGKDEPKTELTEKQRFFKGLREAVSIGSTYTALVPTEIATKIDERRYELSRFRKYCSVMKVGGNYTIAAEGNGVTVDYVGEGAEISESTPTLSTITLNPYKIAALVKVSKEAIADLAVDIEGYIINQIAKGYSLKEDKEILAGTGSSANHMTGIKTALSGKTARIKTTAANDSFTWAEVKAFLGLLGAYRSYSIVAMSQSTADYIHEFKDGNKYMFDQTKPLETIMGVKVVISPDMDDIGAGKTVMVAGDFSYYHICDRLNMEIETLKERYATSGQVGILATERLDGKPSLEEAFALLNIKTA